eukprot:1158593-Pelagomonas_calceolata.AAC.5
MRVSPRGAAPGVALPVGLGKEMHAEMHRQPHLGRWALTCSHLRSNLDFWAQAPSLCFCMRPSFPSLLDRFCNHCSVKFSGAAQLLSVSCFCRVLSLLAELVLACVSRPERAVVDAALDYFININTVSELEDQHRLVYAVGQVTS